MSWKYYGTETWLVVDILEIPRYQQQGWVLVKKYKAGTALLERMPA